MKSLARQVPPAWRAKRYILGIVIVTRNLIRICSLSKANPESPAALSRWQGLGGQEHVLVSSPRSFSAVCRTSRTSTQTLVYRQCADPLQSLYRTSANTVQNRNRLSTDTPQTLYRPSTAPIQTPYRLSTGPLQ